MINFDTSDCCKVSRYSRELRALSKFRDFCRTFYLGQDVDGENVYGGKNDEVRFKNVDDMVKVLDSVIDILHEYEEKQDKEAQVLGCKLEETKINSQALDILARLQLEFPIYARSIHAIETGPSTEKLEFWCMTPDEFEEPQPEIMKIKDATNEMDISSVNSVYGIPEKAKTLESMYPCLWNCEHKGKECDGQAQECPIAEHFSEQLKKQLVKLDPETLRDPFSNREEE